MKKLLAMVLALVMTLSLAVSANALKADEKINEDYAEAVAVLDGMGVFKGYEDGSFKPENKITRAEVATIIYRIYTQDLAKNDKSGLYASYNKFSDMAGAGWAAGYIGYCANAEFVKGYPDGTFKPSGNVTGYEVLTMILRAIGYDKNGEFTGADWALNVAKYAEQAGVLKNVKGVDLNAPATRELVAELLFRAIAKAPMVTYTAAFGYQTVSFNGKADGKTFKDNETLGHKNFELDSKADHGDYGRPTTKWTYNCGNTKTVIYDKPLVTYHEAVSACDLCKDLSEKKEAKAVETWTDGVKSTTAVTYKAVDTKTELGAQGQLVEVYANDDDYTVIAINTYLAKVTKVIEEVKDKNDHVKVEASVNVDVYGTKTNDAGDVTDEAIKDSFETTGFKKDDMVLVTYDNGEIASMEAAKGEVAKLTSVKGAKKVGETTGKMTDILGVGYEKATVAYKATMNPFENEVIALGSSYTFYYDTYGNIIGVDDYTRDANYVVIDRIWAHHDNGKVTYYADLVSADDAKTISSVVIDSIEDKELSDITVDEDYKDNKEFYHDLMVYTVNDDGEYELYQTGIVVSGDEGQYPCAYDAKIDDDRIYTDHQGQGDIYLDKDTVILFQYEDSPNGTFKSYTLENLPEKFFGYVEYVVGSDGKADVVYVRGADVGTSYVFIPDVNKVTSTLNKDKTITTTLEGAKVLNDKGELETKDLKIVSKSKNIVVENMNNLSELTELKAAGLYRLISFGEDNSLLFYTGVEQVQSVKEFSGKDVTGIYVAGSWVEFDESKATYTYWTGDYEGLTGRDDEPYSELLTDKTDANSELKAGDWVFVQYDEDDKVEAVYEVDFEVSVDFDAASKALDKDAKIDAPTMYYGKELKDFTVAVSKWVKVNEVNNGYTFETKKEHSEARTYAVTAADDKLVEGNIVVKLAADPAHSEAWLELKENVTSQNLTVTIDQDKNKVVIDTVSGTIKVNDVAAFLEAAGTHNQGYKFYNNTKENYVPSNSTDDIEISNLFIIVTAENGTEVKYTFTTPWNN